MRVIVDANIVFSAILNTNSKIADLLLSSNGIFEFIAPDYLQNELKKYIHKIADISKISPEEVEIIKSKIEKPISFMSGILYPNRNGYRQKS